MKARPAKPSEKPARPRPVKPAPRDPLFEALRAELGL